MPLEALYRKDRPIVFADVVGQDHIKKTLLNELKTNRVSHAYLFCGPRGVGKTTLARLIAKSVNCLKLKDGEPCNECETCLMINQNKALDIIEIDAASHTGVDNVRDNIINNARVASSILKYKVFIIDEVHMLSISAFNALLKVLEEPPQDIIFILATTEIHKVPETIISRCQRFDFHRVNLKEIIKKLEKIIKAEKINIDLAVLERIAKNSEGSARDAESLLGQIMVLDDKHITLELAELILPKNNTILLVEFFKVLVDKKTREAIEQINQLVEQGIDLEEFNKNLLEFLRQILLYRINGQLTELEYLDVDKNMHQEIIDVLQQTKIQDLVRMIKVFLSKIEDLKSSQIKQLPLELAVIELCETEIQETPIKFTPPPSKKKLDLKLDVPRFEQKIPAKENSQIDSDDKLLNSIKDKWPEIIKDLKQINYSLAMLMSLMQLVAVDKNNILFFGVKHKFHKDLVCNKTNSQIISKIISEKIGQKIKINCLIGEEYRPDISLTNLEKSDNLEPVSEDEASNVWDLALNTFTGSEIKE
jgi:DNA polymerase-3 subunit gamma/tau